MQLFHRTAKYPRQINEVCTEITRTAQAALLPSPVLGYYEPSLGVVPFIAWPQHRVAVEVHDASSLPPTVDALVAQLAAARGAPSPFSPPSSSTGIPLHSAAFVTPITPTLGAIRRVTSAKVAATSAALMASGWRVFEVPAVSGPDGKLRLSEGDMYHVYAALAEAAPLAEHGDSGDASASGHDGSNTGAAAVSMSLAAGGAGGQAPLA